MFQRELKVAGIEGSREGRTGRTIVRVAVTVVMMLVPTGAMVVMVVGHFEIS